MAWTYRLSEGALKDLKKMDKPLVQRIVKYLDERFVGDTDPRQWGEALKGARLGDYWKFRVGDWRLICHLEDQELVVLVLKIGQRKEVYKEK